MHSKRDLADLYHKKQEQPTRVAPVLYCKNFLFRILQVILVGGVLEFQLNRLPEVFSAVQRFGEIIDIGAERNRFRIGKDRDGHSVAAVVYRNV